jgi:hypothetical protein
LVREAQDILRQYDIDPIYGPENLNWAPNRVQGQHSIDALQPLVELHVTSAMSDLIGNPGPKGWRGIEIRLNVPRRACREGHPVMNHLKDLKSDGVTTEIETTEVIKMSQRAGRSL